MTTTTQEVKRTQTEITVSDKEAKLLYDYLIYEGLNLLNACDSISDAFYDNAIAMGKDINGINDDFEGMCEALNIYLREISLNFHICHIDDMYLSEDTPYDDLSAEYKLKLVKTQKLLEILDVHNEASDELKFKFDSSKD